VSKGSSSVYYTATTNNTIYARNTVITISGAGITDTANIAQSGALATMSLSPTTLSNVSSNGTAGTLTLTSNFDANNLPQYYSLDIETDGITNMTASCTGSSISYTIPANTYTSTRSGSIKCVLRYMATVIASASTTVSQQGAAGEFYLVSIKQSSNDYTYTDCTTYSGGYGPGYKINTGSTYVKIVVRCDDGQPTITPSYQYMSNNLSLSLLATTSLANNEYEFKYRATSSSGGYNMCLCEYDGDTMLINGSASPITLYS
jgi:hypothetical protein